MLIIVNCHCHVLSWRILKTLSIKKYSIEEGIDNLIYESLKVIISNPQLAEKFIVKCKNLLSNTISILRHKIKIKK